MKYILFFAILILSNQLLYAQADLIVQTPYITNANVFPGLPFITEYAIKNQGTSTSNSNVTGFYLSNDDSLDVSDIFLSSYAVSSLTTGTYSPQVLYISIPLNTISGNYFILYHTDDNSIIEESNENNNVGSFPIVVTEPTVDYQLNSLSLSTNYAVGGASVSCTGSVFNLGNSTSPQSCPISFFLSTDHILDSSDMNLSNTWIYSINSNSYTIYSTSVGIPYNILAGNYYILAVIDNQNSIAEISENNNMLAKSITIGYNEKDLSIESMNVSTTEAIAGNFFNINPVISNKNNLTIPTNLTLFLSQDSLYDGGDMTLGSTFVSIPPNNLYSNTISTQIPLSTPAGNYFIVGFVDYTNSQIESNENNNFNSVKIEVSNRTIDLLVQNQKSSQLNVSEGSNIIVSGCVVNMGNNSSGSSTVQFYLSTDSIFDATDTYLGFKNFSSVSTSSSAFISESVIIPARPIGNYYILFFADYLNNIPETDETNNVSSIAINFTAPFYDLIIESPTTLSESVAIGHNLNLNCYVTNKGNVAVSSSDIGYYLSSDTILDANDIYLSYLPGGTINSNYLSIRLQTVTIPLNTTIGNYYVLFFADYTNLVIENFEDNNINYMPIDVIEATIDLTIQSVTAVRSYTYPGETFFTSCTILNAGNSNVDLGELAYYLSVDSLLDANDVYISNTSNLLINSGQPVTSSPYFVIPSSTIQGNYYLLYFIDYSNSILETNENNNIKALAITVAATSVDLIIENESLSSILIEAGGQIAIYSRISNVGNAATSLSNSRCYFSSDPVYDVNDVILSTVSVGAIPASGFVNLQIFATIPTGLQTGGNYYILLFADYSNSVNEINEINNNVSLPLFVYIVEVGTENLMPFIGVDTISVCSGYILDHGGLGVYSNSANGILTIIPETPGNFVFLDFNGLSFETCCDKLYIYDGMSISDNLIGTYTVSPGTIYATNVTGALTLKFTSDENEYDAGFIATVSCLNILPRPDLLIQSGATISDSTITVGSNFFHLNTIKNVGTKNSSATSSGYFLSSDTIVDVLDVFLGNSGLYTLNIGSIHTENLLLTIPPGTIVGDYYLVSVLDYLDEVIETVETNNVNWIPISVIAPEFDLSFGINVLNQNEIAQGNELYLNFGIHYEGNTAISNSDVGFYLSLDSIWGLSDVLVGYSLGPALNNDSSSYRSLNLGISSNTQVGEYYLLYVADYLNQFPELNETNNVAWDYLSISPGILDITSIYPTTSTSDVASGEIVTVSSRIFNNGNGNIVSNLGYYFSVDTIWDTLDLYVSNSSDLTISRSSSTIFSTDITIPVSLAIGNYFLLLKADYANSYFENNELNNVSFIPLTIISPEIDLKIMNNNLSNYQIPTGESFDAYCYVLNEGNSESYSSNIDYFLSTDSTWSSNDIFLSSSIGTNLSSNGYSYRSLNLTIPLSTLAGDYYILFINDFSGLANESNENNNVSFNKILVQTPQIDLSSNPPMTFTNIQVGILTTVETTVLNTGNISSSQNTSINCYLSIDTILDGSDLFLTNRLLSSIEAHQDFTTSFLFQLPTNTPLGNYYIITYIDNLNSNTEINEANNTNYHPITLISCTIDLIVLNPALSKTHVEAGNIIGFYYVVYNNGETYTESNNIGTYLSTDTIWSASDISLTSQLSTSLSPHYSTYSSTFTSIPVGTLAGNYYILFFADRNNNINETNETNNVVYIPLFIENSSNEITQIDSKNNLLVYPNPAKDFTIIALSEYQNQHLNFIEVYGLDGRLIKSEYINTKKTKFELDLSNFSSGTYVIKTHTSNQEIFVSKINVQK